MYPDALIYPLNEKGRTSKKLEDIAPANGFQNHKAHDALGDVEATIFVADLIKSKAPILWKAALDAKNRHEARMRANRTPVFLIHDRNYGHPITFPAAIIGAIHNGRDLLVADLRFDAPAQSEISIDRLFKGPTRLCRTIKLAEAPLLFSLEEFHSMPHSYKWDQTTINDRLELWASIKEKIDITELYSEQLTPFEKAEYPEAAIYEDFEAFDRDAQIMRSFHEANPTEKLELVNCFSDPRFRTFARRIIYDNYYEILNSDERTKFELAISNRLNHQEEVPWITAPRAIEEAEKLIGEHPNIQAELEKIKDFFSVIKITTIK